MQEISPLLNLLIMLGVIILALSVQLAYEPYELDRMNTLVRDRQPSSLVCSLNH